MTNTASSEVTLRALKLDKTCFTGPQDMLEAFARALVVPTQAGRDGIDGVAGTNGSNAQNPVTVEKVTAETGVTFVDINADLDKGTVSLTWVSSSTPSPVISITYIEKLNEGSYRVHFSAATGSVKGWTVTATTIA